MQIRRALTTDLSQARQLQTRSTLKLCSTYYSSLELQHWLIELNADNTRVQVCKDYTLVAEENGCIVGFGILSVTNSLIEALYVDPDHACSGIGSKILSALEDRAHQLGIREIQLLSTLNAQSFYLKANYQRLTSAKLVLESGIELECVLMKKMFDYQNEQWRNKKWNVHAAEEL